MENKNKNCPEYSEAKDIGLAKHWMGSGFNKYWQVGCVLLFING